MATVGTHQIVVDATCMLCGTGQRVVGVRIATHGLKVDRWFVCRGCLTATPDALGASLREQVNKRRHGVEELERVTNWLLDEHAETADVASLIDWNERLREFRERVP